MQIRAAPPAERISRVARVLAWIVLGSALALEALNMLRIHLGYEPFDSQWALPGLVSLFGLLLLFFLILLQLVFCTVGLILAWRGRNRAAVRRLWIAVAITLAGAAILLLA